MACIQSVFNKLKTWNWRAFLLLSLATIVPKQGLSADCSLYWWLTDLISNWRRLVVCCELMNNTENVWTMVELAALTRMFEKVYLICTSRKRNQWKWTLQTNYTYYFGRSHLSYISAWSSKIILHNWSATFIFTDCAYQMYKLAKLF